MKHESIKLTSHDKAVLDELYTLLVMLPTALALTVLLLFIQSGDVSAASSVIKDNTVMSALVATTDLEPSEAPFEQEPSDQPDLLAQIARNLEAFGSSEGISIDTASGDTPSGMRSARVRQFLDSVTVPAQALATPPEWANAEVKIYLSNVLKNAETESDPEQEQRMLLEATHDVLRRS